MIWICIAIILTNISILLLSKQIHKICKALKTQCEFNDDAIQCFINSRNSVINLKDYIELGFEKLGLNDRKD